MRSPITSSEDKDPIWALEGLKDLDLSSAHWLEPELFMTFVRSRWPKDTVDPEYSSLSENAPMLDRLRLPDRFSGRQA